MQDFRVSGTYVWYYMVCKREVWLMSRAIVPDERHQSVDIGRFVHINVYAREKKEVEYGGMKFDLFKSKGGSVIIGEIKKSSRHMESAKMQLLFYLYELEKAGVHATGQLLVPEERLRVDVILDEESREKIISITDEITSLVETSLPPPPEKCPFCNSCAYAELCWA